MNPASDIVAAAQMKLAEERGRMTTEGQFGCNYCDRELNELEVRFHAAECAQERISKLEKTVAELEKTVAELRYVVTSWGEK